VNALVNASASVRMISRDPANTDGTDFTPTPLPVARAMVELEPWGPAVWEPACGDGAISGEFLRRGHQVVETDIAPRIPARRLNFLDACQLAAPEICSNPPFNASDAFVEHALNLGATRVMMLLPLGWMQGVEAPRPALLWQRGLARVWVSARRIPFLRGGWDGGKGGGPVHKHALFVWEAGYAGDPVLKHFDWRDWA
jgi:hypothetical protein